MPTKNSFCFLSSGPIILHIILSDLEIDVFLADPPIWILERISFILGTLEIAPTGLPSTKIILLSPLIISGRYFWTIKCSLLVEIKVSIIWFRLMSLLEIRKTPSPPFP